jgi:hypothetical protein
MCILRLAHRIRSIFEYEHQVAVWIVSRTFLFLIRSSHLFSATSVPRESAAVPWTCQSQGRFYMKDVRRGGQRGYPVISIVICL